MHPYATPTRRWKTVGVLMFIAIVLTSGLNELLQIFGRQLGFQTGGLSSFGVFTALYLGFNRYFWRWPVVSWFTSAPDLNGKWIGDIESSYDPESVDDEQQSEEEYSEDEEPKLLITQDWSSIEVTVVSPGSSRSESTSATFRTHKSDPELLFTYLNKPTGEAANELSMHEGTNTLRYAQNTEGNDILEGEYYTDEQRNNHGTMRFTRMSE